MMTRERKTVSSPLLFRSFFRRPFRPVTPCERNPARLTAFFPPISARLRTPVNAVLADWNIPECTELEGDIFRISFEGVFFPLDDVLDALRPLLCAESSVKSI